MGAELIRLGEEIRRRRKAKKLSQVVFAANVGISNKTLDNIEAGRNWPSLPVYISIAIEFGLQPPMVPAA